MLWLFFLKFIYFRPYIGPNEGFCLQLALFEVEHLGALSIGKHTSKHWNFYALNNIIGSLPKDYSGSASEQLSEDCCVIQWEKRRRILILSCDDSITKRYSIYICYFVRADSDANAIISNFEYVHKSARNCLLSILKTVRRLSWTKSLSFHNSNNNNNNNTTSIYSIYVYV